MAKKICLICGNTIGTLTGKIKCLDGLVLGDKRIMTDDRSIFGIWDCLFR